MNQYLKSYQVIIHTVGPVFIGSGREINKKEYILLNRKLVGIPDIQALYRELQKRKKDTAFEEYMLGKGSINLTSWLHKQNIPTKDIMPFIKYTLEGGDAIIDKGANRLQIMECIKDAYGKPYIPGSSLKGMFRTILLGADIRSNPDKYKDAKENMRRNAERNENRNFYLKKSAEEIESIAYRTLSKNEKKKNDAVNDLMQGFIVSDSAPLSTDALVLCQKIDRHTDGTEKHLPLLRECIKPDTKIQFTLTIDASICQLTDETLKAAIKNFMTSHYNNFARAFTGLDKPRVNYVLCGGGCGFVSKTIIYPLYKKEEGIKFAQKVFDKTKVSKAHKHHLDQKYGASPHIIKCTEYQGKTLQMGMCKIEKITQI